MKIVAVIVAAIFTVSGAVNLGAFGIFPAIPFVVFLLFTMFKWGKKFVVIGLVVLVLITPIYIFRKTSPEKFLKSQNKEIVTLTNLCLTKYHDTKQENFVLSGEMRNEKDCDSSNIHGAQKWEVLPKGSTLKIESIQVSHADMGEKYSITSKVPLGKLVLLYPHNASFDGVEPLTEDDLRYKWLYRLSLLMYWPIFPMMIRTLF